MPNKPPMFFRLLTLSLALYLVAIMAIASSLDGPKALQITGLLMLITTTISFCYALVALVRTLQLPWTWVALSLIAHPFGPVLTYVRVRKAVEKRVGSP
jgi:hypothetical protein